MAEFIEVMKQANRMCNACGCSSCPVHNMCDVVTLLTPEYAEQFVKAVTKWAAEHPEPQYPTWREWLERKALVKMKPVFVNMTNTVEYVLTDEAGEQIPADIAEKLGIQPKGAKGDG